MSDRNAAHEPEVIGVPAVDEYSEWHARYVNLASEATDLLALFTSQPDTYRKLVFGMPESDGATRPAPEEWSVKEVIGHVADSERVFAYRLIALARGETSPLPPFDQDPYVAFGKFNQRTFASLLDEFELQRRANLLAIEALRHEDFDRRGTVANNSQSVRSLVYILAGHAQHHIISLQTDYARA